MFISTLDNRIRMVTKSTGFITTFVGNGAFGYLGDGVPAFAASITSVYGMEVYQGSLYIADYNNKVTKMFDLLTKFWP